VPASDTSLRWMRREREEKNLRAKLLFFEDLAFPCLVHCHSIQRCPLLLRKKKKKDNP